MLTYIDATADPECPVEYPEYVMGFMDLGCHFVGRIRAEPTDGTHQETAEMYGGEYRQAYLDHCSDPTPVLRSPDSDAFVEISWFWDSPSVRMRTMLADGSLVETLRRWDYPPPVPHSLVEHKVRYGIDEEMYKHNVPDKGRSTTVVTSSVPAELWQHHVEHVARYSAARGSRPIQHEDLATHVQISKTTFDHDTSCAHAVSRLWKPAVMLWGLVALLAVILVAWVASATIAAGVALVCVAVTGAVTRRVINFHSLPRRFRPSYV